LRLTTSSYLVGICTGRSATDDIIIVIALSAGATRLSLSE
jgi:hypothetical protein